MPGARCTRSLVCSVVVEHTSVVTTGPPEHPAFPHAMVLTAYSVLSPATNSSCHRRWRIDGMSKARSGRHASANLTPATGARTTRLCRPRKAPFVCAPFNRSRAKARPAITLRAQRCRVHRIPPRVRDDRDTPLWGTGRRRI